MIIRNALHHDIHELVTLCIEHAAYERSEFDPAGKEEALHRMLFAPDARLHCLVVEEDDGLSGYATFSVECSTWDADYLPVPSTTSTQQGHWEVVDEEHCGTRDPRRRQTHAMANAILQRGCCAFLRATGSGKEGEVPAVLG